MERKPLDIPWKELLSDREHAAADVVVVPGSRGGGGEQQQALPGEPCSLATLTDHMLEERIERVQRHIASGFTSKLPDKGAKLLASLRSLEEERERRKSLVRSANDKDDEECKEIKQLPRRSPPDSLNHSSSNATTSIYPSESFGFHFCKLLEAKVNHGNCDAHSEELNIICKEDSSDLIELDGKRNSPRMSSRSSAFRSTRSVNSKDRQKSCNSRFEDIGVSSTSSFQRGEMCSNQFSKRRKSPENHSSVDLNPTEVQDVVFLDEEVQHVEQIREGDENDDRLPSSKEAKFYFPSRDHPECVELSQSDLKCLEPESYLSSTIMNFYILYLQKTISMLGRPRGEYHFFNTYFYRKLEEATSQREEISKHITKLRRWWKGVNIFEKAYIFLPIHGEYLKEEWAYLNGGARPLDLPISERIWRNLPQRIEKKKITVPQQKNDYDCGLFVLYFMERFIEAAPARLRREDLAMFGKKWFHPEEASGLRQRLRDLLERFIKLEQSPEGESPAD